MRISYACSKPFCFVTGLGWFFLWIGGDGQDAAAAVPVLAGSSTVAASGCGRQEQALFFLKDVCFNLFGAFLRSVMARESNNALSDTKMQRSLLQLLFKMVWGKANLLFCCCCNCLWSLLYLQRNILVGREGTGVHWKKYLFVLNLVYQGAFFSFPFLVPRSSRAEGDSVDQSLVSGPIWREAVCPICCPHPRNRTFFSVDIYKFLKCWKIKVTLCNVAGLNSLIFGGNASCSLGICEELKTEARTAWRLFRH